MYISVAPEGCTEPSMPPMILGLNLLCAATWDTLQGSSTAGSKTKIYLIIGAWVILPGNALCVRQCRAGLFSVVRSIQGWEVARSHEPSEISVPPYHRRCQAGPKSHLSQRVTPAFSLFWAKKMEFCRVFFPAKDRNNALT